MNLLMKKNPRNRKIYFKKRGGGNFLSIPLFFLLLGLLSSCGLASYPVVYPPTTTTDLIFYHNTNNTVSPNFIVLGYDIVYRIYIFKKSTGIPPDETTIENDASQYISSSVFSSIISNNWDTMTVYRRLNADNGNGPGLSTPPIYPINDEVSTSYSISINIDTTGEPESYLQDDLGTTLYFNRYMGKDVPPKNFTLSDFSAGDIDVPDDGSTTYDPAVYGITVAFFCYTYGLSKDLLSLHSNMVYIGSYTF